MDITGMRRERALLTLVLALGGVAAAGCEPGDRQEMANVDEVVDSVRETGTARAHDTAGGDSAATALRAPQMIEGLEQHLERMRADPRAAAENMTGYKFMLADVADAMTEDLSRMAATDTAAFVEQRDEVVDDVGGGPGSSGTLKPEDFPQHIAKVERLLETYRRLSAPAATTR